MMTITTTLISLSIFFLAGHGYILDMSCDDYIGDMADWMGEAFKHARSALDLLQNPPECPDTSIERAQLGLISLLFEDLMDEEDYIDPLSGAWDRIPAVYEKVLKYDTKGDGSPSQQPADYRSLIGQGMGARKPLSSVT